MQEETPSPPPDVLVTGHYREQFGYRVYRAHGSGNWLATYTVEGHGLYRQPGLSLRTEPGDLVLLGPGALHDYRTPRDCSWEFLWAHFHPGAGWHPLWRPPAAGDGLYVARLRDARARERVRRAFARLHGDARAAGPLGRELALNGLEEVLLLAAREHQPAGEGPLDDRVRHALDILSRDLAAPHDLRSLAEQVALSPSRLAHLFKEQMGDSVMNTLLTLRLREAARLLEYTVRSVGAISEEVGFSSPYYFSRQFRKRFGVSPREYRQQVAMGGPGQDEPAEVRITSGYPPPD
jgi:AraC family transcriptional regulator of arabinose operon